MSLDRISLEDRKLALIKAKESREKLIEDAKLLQHDWSDQPHWKMLASKHSQRLPAWYQPANPKNMRKCVKKLGKDVEWFREVTGFESYKHHQAANPRMPAYCFMGLLLEQLDEEEAYDYEQQD